MEPADVACFMLAMVPVLGVIDVFLMVWGWVEIDPAYIRTGMFVSWFFYATVLYLAVTRWPETVLAASLLGWNLIAGRVDPGVLDACCIATFAGYVAVLAWNRHELFNRPDAHKKGLMVFFGMFVWNERAQFLALLPPDSHRSIEAAMRTALFTAMRSRLEPLRPGHMHWALMIIATSVVYWSMLFVANWYIRRPLAGPSTP